MTIVIFFSQAGFAREYVANSPDSVRTLLSHNPQLMCVLESKEHKINEALGLSLMKLHLEDYYDIATGENRLTSIQAFYSNGEEIEEFIIPRSSCKPYTAIILY